jgi:transcription elongation factor Elf1
MTEKLRFECIHCNAEGYIAIAEDPMEFYKIRYCPCCGEELELEEGFNFIDKFEEEYNASND